MRAARSESFLRRTTNLVKRNTMAPKPAAMEGAMMKPAKIVPRPWK